MLHVAFVTNILSHYRVTSFASLARLLPNQITFYFLTKTMSHRKYILSEAGNELPAVWLNGLTWHRPPDDDKHLNDIRPILKGDHDVLVLGAWDEPSYFMLWLWGILRSKKIVFSIESTAFDGDRRGLKEAYKKTLLGQAKACIVPGSRAFEYCCELGVDPERIFRAPNATDGIVLSNRAKELTKGRNAIRNEMGAEGVVILFVGRLVEKYKTVSTLIRGFRELSGRMERIDLFVVGDGPDRSSYEGVVKELGIKTVRFLGEMTQDQLCRVYAAADILVLPSRCEPWGFVLNEGMEFGLPLIVSDAVGAGPDLVHPGENGFVFPVGDSEALARYLEILVRDESLRKRMGEKSKEIIKDFTPEAWAQGVLRAINAVAGKKSVASGPWSIVNGQ